MRLLGQRALVTGAASGIGRAITICFAREGARVALFDLDGEAANALAGELRAEGLDAVALQGTVTETQSVERGFAECDRLLGGIDILVNNAGVTGNMPTLELTDEFWDRTIAINLRGPFLCSRAAGRRMVQQGSGVILNVASMYGVVAAPDRLAYCASKSAVCMMTKVLAIEWGDRGVRVNALAPGYVSTPSTEILVENGRLDLERLKARTPLRRIADPDEIAVMAVQLCSAEAAFVTGQVIAVDGGWSAYGYV